ncbi:hypothetical protein [Pseudomonas sp. MUP55]|uniref:hypothetical protein n=1 Tax=Pseudomonas sp. MUP55 TaxID=3087234 RepID=UPI002A5AC6EC|nr:MULTISPECIES: hypothetical protein [unclassified Pseudomonas]WPN92819.1 hypothetical protein SC319_00105 [Pseudomonas sp. MUP56]WPN98345.1 hypothetical protein SC318_00105 [Pseudomonas sp. MUP55]
MQKQEITQTELDAGNGNFDNYMKYVIQRVAAKGSDPAVAIFIAADIICSDGHALIIGSTCDSAGTNVINWIDGFYSKRAHISYCLPSIAYTVHGAPFLLRMPALREEKMPVTEAVVELSDRAASAISSSKFSLLESEYNEFYDALELICRIDTSIVAHLESAARCIYDGAAHYAMARWESLHFIEKAMKEVLFPLGVKIEGSAGHDLRGALHTAWKDAGKPSLPAQLIDDVMCSSSMRYERTEQPYSATIRAHHSSIRLGALISRELAAAPTMTETLSISLKSVSRDPLLAITRVISALDQAQVSSQFVELTR